MSDTTKRYKIETLLATAVQPFDPLSEAEMAGLEASIKASIGRGRGLPDPVSMTADGSEIVFDGSQRLTALRHLGRTYIDTTDVREVEGSTAQNALEYSVMFQVHRRQMTIEDKARIARRLQVERGWAQTKIARVFRVSQPAVSQWLSKTGLGEGAEVTEVEGVDGVVRDVSAQVARRGAQRTRLTARAVQPHPWSRDGECLVLVRKLTSRIEGAAGYPETLVGLDADERDVMLTNLQDLASVLDGLITQLEPPE